MIFSAHQASLFCTVALLAVTGYFFFGSVPLLILKHDTPMDARFVRSFYVVYYRVAIVTASAKLSVVALAGRPLLAFGAAVIALLAWVVRGHFIPRMESLAPHIQAHDTATVSAFRKIHLTAILINVVQMIAVVSALTVF
jgi:hypothetical protein